MKKILAICLTCYLNLLCVIYVSANNLEINYFCSEKLQFVVIANKSIVKEVREEVNK